MNATNPIDLYVATTNPGKLRDFAAASAPGIAIHPLPGLDAIEAPEENQSTFAGNARLKAIVYSRRAPGLLVLADDSGLEVDALHGAPGVRSARFAEDSGFTSRRSMSTDQRNNLCLLDALGATREGDRGARYRCTLAVARNGQILLESDGAVEGEIVAVPRGNNGFGYDPLFLLPDLGLTMGEVSADERAQHSHRARALTALLRAFDRENSDRITKIAQS